MISRLASQRPAYSMHDDHVEFSLTCGSVDRSRHSTLCTLRACFPHPSSWPYLANKEGQTLTQTETISSLRYKLSNNSIKVETLPQRSSRNISQLLKLCLMDLDRKDRTPDQTLRSNQTGAKVHRRLHLSLHQNRSAVSQTIQWGHV